MKKIFYFLLLCFMNQLYGAATIQGTVTDATTGLPIPGALVLAIRGNAVRFSDVTDLSGNYSLTNLQPSNYNLVVLASGYQNQIVGVKPRNNQTTVVNFQLVPTGGTISGTVIDANTLLPIAGATVSIFNGLNFITSTTTNGSGVYSVPNLAPGNYTVLVRATNYRGQVQGATVVAGSTTTVNFALQPQPGTISGTITDALTTAPIPGAFVEIFDGFTKVGFADTDLAGNYTIDGLAPGNYTVVASADGYRTKAVGAIVVANTTTTINLALTPNPGSVAGQVTNAQTGAPIASANIVIIQNGTIVTSVLTDSDGNYSVDNLAPGDYIISANASQFRISITGVSITSDTITTVNFALNPIPGTIAGTVTDFATSLPIAGAFVQVFNDTILVANAITDPNGNYQIPNLEPGNYTVVASASNFQTQAQPATVAANSTTIINFALLSNPGTIMGTVTDALTTNPIANASIFVFQGQTIIATSLTDPNGIYTVAGLAPGNYVVLVRASGYQTAFSTAAVTAGGTTIVNFALQVPFGSLEGTITQVCTQDPIGGALVLLLSGDVIVDFAVSDNNGAYTISNLAPGSYTVTVIKNNYPTKVKTATIISQETTTVNFVLDPIIPPSPLPPASISGFIIQNKYLTQTDFIHEIVWTQSPSKCITEYLIFRNGQQIADVPSTDRRFIDLNYAKRAATYMVKAVNGLGGISDPATIIFN